MMLAFALPRLRSATFLTFALVVLIPGSWRAAGAQEVSRSFELRYITDDPAANGPTDFKGETAVFDTDQRVEFLRHYADYAARFFDDPDLDRLVVSDEEVEAALARLEPQPLPRVRRRIRLDAWKWLGYRPGQHEEQAAALATYASWPGIALAGGALHVTADRGPLAWTFPSQPWRSRIEWKARAPSRDRHIAFALTDRDLITAAEVGFGADGRVFYTSAGRTYAGPAYAEDAWHHFVVELDFSQEERNAPVRYNLYVDGARVADYVPMDRVREPAYEGERLEASIGQVNTFRVDGVEGLRLDDLLGVGYHLTGRVNHPFTWETFLDEGFESRPDADGFETDGYTDTLWQTGTLPIVHGSERHAGEALYLRRWVDVGAFERAVLNIEALDPGGEVYVNGRAVAVLNDRYPAAVDVTRFLRPGAANLIAVRVHPFYLTEDVGEIMPHSALDFNVGWSAGRMWLDLTSRSTIEDVFVYTEALGDPARLRVRVTTHGRDYVSLRGALDVRLAPWPSEPDEAVATARLPVTLTRKEQTFDIPLDVPGPRLWTPDDPALYALRVTLVDDEAGPVDDAVVTTGIRTVTQEGGTFRLNGAPSMLNGAVLMGHRGPLDRVALYQRTPPAAWLAREILMMKKGGGNQLRVHVHGWQSPARNVNDPRLPELADQMGMMLIWTTPAWIRTGRGWGQVDFEGLPRYMRQVYNHPSIVMWEVSNHPKSFKHRDYSESNIFVETAYETVRPVDPSRLISYSSFIEHLHYGNDAGTIDQEGNPMTPSPAWTAPEVVRGNQDSPTGYGKEWSVLRQWPGPYRQSFLDSDAHAYFNFEHEESIGQANWTLVRGKPWYRIHSYEWDYDVGSIGRRLALDEWRESQAWQAFSGWEATKKQRLLDYDGFSWITLHGGANTFTYAKPFIDPVGYAKLAFYTQRMIYQPVVAGSDDVDVAYGPGDVITPVIVNLGASRRVDLRVSVLDADGNEVDAAEYANVLLPEGRTSTRVQRFRPDVPGAAHYRIVYTVTTRP